MDCNQAIEMADALLLEKKGIRLTDLQRLLLQSAWDYRRLSYREIAQTCGYSESYLKYDVGPDLWQLLSEVLQEKVSKINVRSVLERQGRLSGSTAVFPAPVDWGEAIDTPAFYGRKGDLQQLSTWILGQPPCRLVAILGMGGIGKSALSVKLATQLRPHFEQVVWRSLRHAPSLSSLIQDLLQGCGHPLSDARLTLPDQIASLLTHLKTHRCLIVLDNVEAILASETPCHYRPGFEAYGSLFQTIGEVASQSTLVITSREKPKEVAWLEGRHLPVRSHPLSGLTQADTQALLQQKGAFSGTPQDWHRLTQHYAGNPLALKIVATAIADLFGGSLSTFLRVGVTVFGDIRDLLEQQCRRLSPVEQTLIDWLAINQEPTTLTELRSDWVGGIAADQLLEAVESLHRRSLLEENQGCFTLPPVVVEYLLTRLVDRISDEIQQQSPQLLRTHALVKARAKDPVRETQVRLILKPLLQRLQQSSGLDLLAYCQQLLRSQQRQPAVSVGYIAGNVINLLCHTGLSLRGLDCSYLTIRQAYLQEVALPEVNFEGSQFRQCLFTQRLGNVLAVALSPDGERFATGTADGDITLWQTRDHQPLLTLAGHAGRVWALAFSPDGRCLASGGDDRAVRLWQLDTGGCRQFTGHKDWVFAVAFSPDGRFLASGGSDGRVCLWGVDRGVDQDTGDSVLQGHSQAVRAVAFSSTQPWLATTGDDQTIRLWDIATGQLRLVLRGHRQRIDAVAFSPDGQRLASGSCDHTLRLWDPFSGEALGCLEGHCNWIFAVAFDPSGRWLASCGGDHAIKLWDLGQGGHRTLSGHVNRVCALAFSPDGHTLISGGNDHTVKFWQVVSGQCLRTLKGHASRVNDVAFSPDGQLLASAHSDQVIRLWRLATGQCWRVLRGHTNWVWCVAFSPDGRLLASGGDDQICPPWWVIRLWDVVTGDCIRVLSGHQSWVQAIAFSPDGQTLASGSCDQTLRLWDLNTGQSQPLMGHRGRVWSIAFSPDGQTLASGGDDATVRLWDVATGSCRQVDRSHRGWVQAVAFSPDGQWLASGSSDQTVRLWHLPSGGSRICQGHTNWVRSLAFSPDGQWLASGSSDQTIRLWDWQTERCQQVLKGHQNWVRSVAFAPDGKQLASGSQDETIGLWQVQTGKLERTLRPELPYANMNIAQVSNLSLVQRTALKDLGAVETYSRPARL